MQVVGQEKHVGKWMILNDDPLSRSLIILFLQKLAIISFNKVSQNLRGLSSVETPVESSVQGELDRIAGWPLKMIFG